MEKWRRKCSLKKEILRKKNMNDMFQKDLDEDEEETTLEEKWRMEDG